MGLLVFLLGLLGPDTQAYVLTPPTRSPQETVRRLIQKSSLILTGTVVRMEPRLATTGSAVVTDVDLQVSQTLKGRSPAGEVRVVTLGGCVDQVCFQTDLAPRFEMGENVLLFLKKNNEGSWILSDPLYAKYRTREGRANPRGVPWNSFRQMVKAEGNRS